jgi:hypothetical protein
MRRLWATALVSLVSFTCGARAEDSSGNPVPFRQPTTGSTLSSAVSLGRPLPVTLGRPVALDNSSPPPAPLDSSIRLSGYDSADPDPLLQIQAVDPSVPPPPTPIGTPVPGPPPVVAPPPGLPVVPGTPNEQYNCGVVTTPPATGTHPFLDKCHELFGGCKHLFEGVCGGAGAGTGICHFQSDQGFPGLISPVSNPFLFEDPRALTELRPIFMWQGTPRSNIPFRGGDIEYAGLQARLAFNQRLDLVISELGFVWVEPHDLPGTFNHVGFAEVRIGPKYTFYRCESTGTVAAAGLNFDLPVGDGRVGQNTGNLSLEPYVSVGQNFGRSSFGSFNFLGTLGYSLATDNERTDFLFLSLHLDYDVANAHKIYPFLELNDFLYTSAGKAIPDVGFEGRDLFNFGTMGVGGNNTFTLAPGFRYKFTENFQAGLAYEFPLGGHRDLIDYRLTVDLIFRF